MAITIRTTEEQDKNIEILKRRVDEKSSSKALLKAAVLIPKFYDDLYDKNIRIKQLEDELYNIKHLINQANETKNELLVLANK